MSKWRQSADKIWTWLGHLFRVKTIGDLVGWWTTDAWSKAGAMSLAALVTFLGDPPHWALVPMLLLLFFALLAGVSFVLRRLRPFPIVTIRYCNDESPFTRGFLYLNHGPGPAFNITVCPLVANGYKATFPTVPELSAAEQHHFIATIEAHDASAPSVAQCDLAAVVKEDPLDLVLLFEDGHHFHRKTTFQIRADYFGEKFSIQRKSKGPVTPLQP